MSLRPPLRRLLSLRQPQFPIFSLHKPSAPPSRSFAARGAPITRIDPPPPKFPLRTKTKPKPAYEREPPGPLPQIIFGTTTILLVGYLIYLTSRNNAPKVLSPDTFLPFNLTSITPISTKSSKTAIFTIAPEVNIKDLSLPRETGIVSVQIVQPAMQILRPYTPLPSSPGELRFLIKLEHGGEMSRYLFSMAPGAKIHCRGPFSTYKYPAYVGKGGEGAIIAFVAGGTGIAPAIQVAESLLSQNEQNRMRVLWAVRYRDETRGEMEKEVVRLKERFGDRFEMDVFVDEERRFIGLKDIRRVIEGERKKVVLVSGPDGFVGYVAGEKEWKGGKELQWRLGGLLGKALEGREDQVIVWKL